MVKVKKGEDWWTQASAIRAREDKDEDVMKLLVEVIGAEHLADIMKVPVNYVGDWMMFGITEEHAEQLRFIYRLALMITMYTGNRLRAHELIAGHEVRNQSLQTVLEKGVPKKEALTHAFAVLEDTYARPAPRPGA